jgi:tetraacyldisaccharide-1-P 4'-kinase
VWSTEIGGMVSVEVVCVGKMTRGGLGQSTIND